MTGKPVPTQRSETGYGGGEAAARLSLVSNFVLTILKVSVGLLIRSVSVLAEAVHSMSDPLASGLTLVSVRAAERPRTSPTPTGAEWPRAFRPWRRPFCCS